MKVYLSYILDSKTPSYGNRKKFICAKDASIEKGDIVNDSSINTTVHMGTHIDLPYHFYDHGATIEQYKASFWNFDNILFIEKQFNELLVENELIEILEKTKDKNKYEILIVKTGMCNKREDDSYWDSNYGFSPKVAQYLRENYKNIRVFGFDTISLTSYKYRDIGKQAHREFLDTKDSILVLEDMDLREVNQETKFVNLVIAPLRIANCDGLPCTVICEID